MPRTNFNGQIEVITGCMFAGKTEELLRRLRRAEIAGETLEVFTPETDGRYGETQIGSHSGQTWSASVIETTKDGADELYNKSVDADIVAIDEFNFFTDAFLKTARKLAKEQTRVIISGTDQTFRGEPFDPVHKAMAIADDVEKLTAICEECGGTATMNQRLLDGEPAPAEAPTIQVGGAESYEARCRNCHEIK